MLPERALSSPADAPTGPILVVDDDAPLREALRDTLGLVGLEAATAADGAEAIAWLAGRRPSLVLLDLSTPVAGGEAVAAALRERYGEAVPIVVISASSQAAARAQHVRARDFLRKPFDVADLLNVVQDALRRTAAGGAG